MRVESYELRFDFKFNDLKYRGIEIIRGKFEDTAELDCDGLSIESVKADGRDVEFEIGGGKLKIKGADSDSLTVTFSGNVSSLSLMGIHESRYESGRIITTQMEPTGARSVFPCVDRPDAKARFKIEVNVDARTEVISNMSPVVREISDYSSHFVFGETPPMSTYLLYLGIGDFDTLSRSRGGRTVIVATSPGKASEGLFSLKLLQRLLPRYERYYKIGYPFKKVHLVALPQFGAGAMENWGAITFRESALLVNKSVSFSQKKGIAYTVSHEFAHQWFGDLVTMKWWDDLWLNESFATFVGYKILAKLHPDWNLWEDFLREETLQSMSKDSLLGTHPVRVPVSNPDEIAEIFDEISYGKGASILRMTEEFLGETKFRDGVYRYLKKFEYSNATSHDLWQALSEVSGKDVASLMRSWLDKAGMPVVAVTREGDAIQVSQRRFTYKNNEDDYIWEVPLFIDRGKRTSKILLKERNRKLKINGRVLIDPKGVGYYRLLLRGELLRDALQSDPSPGFLAKLVDDYYSFLLSGDISFQEFSDLVQMIKQRNDYTLVLRTGDVLQQLSNVVDSNEVVSIAKEYFAEKLKLFEAEREENSKVIVDNFSTALAVIDPEFREKQKERIKEFGNVPAEQRLSVLLSSAMDNYEKAMLWDMLRSPENDVESVRTVLAMGMMPETRDVLEFLNFSISRTELRGNLIYAIYGALRNRNFRAEIWDWLTTNLGTIREIYKGSSSISRLIEQIIALDGIGHRDKVEAFLRSNSIPEASIGIKNGLERLDVNEALIARIARK
ncbi:MAG: M1 family metallopeptidase [Thermoplasmata archaeon]